MSSSLYPRRVELPSSSNALVRRGFLAGWDAAEFAPLKYSYGLTGVDQVGNFMWVEVFLYLLLACAIALLALRIVGMVFKHLRHLSVMSAPDRQNYWARNQTSWWPWLNRHLLMAPLHKQKHAATFQISSSIDNGTLPGRWHCVLLLVYVGLNVAWCLALPWHEAESKAVVAALRGRSGTLAALNLIPTILFAMRNNPLIGLLQVSYDDFNLFHRWGARVTILESIVHTGCWIHNTLKAKGWDAVSAGLRDEPSYTWGMVATVAFTFIAIQAWSPFRHAFYETFLNIHRLMAVLAFVGLWLHLERHGLPQLSWMYLVVFFWAGEWALRAAWILYFNIGLRRRTRMRVEAMPGEAVRVTIDLVRSWHVRPGAHVHIYMPRLAGWASHPFSIAWATPVEPSAEKASLASLEGGTSMDPAGPPRTRQISLICRARTGFTRQLYEKACQAPSASFETGGFVEGPYGGHHSLASYGTVLLFAGGVGITHQVLFLQQLIQGYNNGTTATQRILLCWTVPDSECLEWVRPWMDAVLRMPGRKRVLRIKLFISRPKGRVENRVSDSVKMFAGRMNIETIVEEEVKSRVGAMAVTCCASGQMADGVRKEARKWVEEGAVEYIEEAFTY